MDNSSQTAPKLSDAEVESQTQVVLDTAQLDPRIAWRVLQTLLDAKIAGPWKESPKQNELWERKDPQGKPAAQVAWARNPIGGDAIGAYGRTYPATEPPRRFQTAEAGMLWLDAHLKKLGWEVVPPIGRVEG